VEGQRVETYRAVCPASVGQWWLSKRSVPRPFLCFGVGMAEMVRPVFLALTNRRL